MEFRRFYAASYTWASRKRTNSVFCKFLNFNITQSINRTSKLRNLRKTESISSIAESSYDELRNRPAQRGRGRNAWKRSSKKRLRSIVFFLYFSLALPLSLTLSHRVTSWSGSSGSAFLVISRRVSSLSSFWLIPAKSDDSREFSVSQFFVFFFLFFRDRSPIVDNLDGREKSRIKYLVVFSLRSC